MDTKSWLTKAVQDLRRVEILLDADPPDVEGALYDSQQAAEKALKGFLTWHDVPFRRVHELDVIGGQCADLDPTLTGLVERADTLTNTRGDSAIRGQLTSRQRRKAGPR